jgi:hypothetical protein
MTQDTTSQLIGKCGRGHVVRGTHNTFAGYSANVERGSFLRCECGAAAVIKFLDVRVVEGMLCSGKCTGATGPVCSCSCGGRNHGGRNVFGAQLFDLLGDGAR